MFAGISLIINSKAAVMSKTKRYTQIQDLIKKTIRDLWKKFHGFYKTFQAWKLRSNTPTTREVDWMKCSRHNKNVNRHTEIPAFIREKNMFSPSLRSFKYSVLITTKASQLKKWYSDQP